MSLSGRLSPSRDQRDLAHKQGFQNYAHPRFPKLKISLLSVVVSQLSLSGRLSPSRDPRDLRPQNRVSKIMHIWGFPKLKTGLVSQTAFNPSSLAAYLQCMFSIWFRTHSLIMECNHGLINYNDTNTKCRHLKKITCKGTSRQVFIRVYRLEIQSVPDPAL